MSFSALMPDCHIVLAKNNVYIQGSCHVELAFELLIKTSFHVAWLLDGN